MSGLRAQKVLRQRDIFQIDISVRGIEANEGFGLFPFFNLQVVLILLQTLEPEITVIVGFDRILLAAPNFRQSAGSTDDNLFLHGVIDSAGDELPG